MRTDTPKPFAFERGGLQTKIDALAATFCIVTQGEEWISGANPFVFPVNAKIESSEKISYARIANPRDRVVKILAYRQASS